MFAPAQIKRPTSSTVASHVRSSNLDTGGVPGVASGVVGGVPNSVSMLLKSNLFIGSPVIMEERGICELSLGRKLSCVVFCPVHCKSSSAEGGSHLDSVNILGTGVGSSDNITDKGIKFVGGVGDGVSLSSAPLGGVGGGVSLSSAPLGGVGGGVSLSSAPLGGVGGGVLMSLLIGFHSKSTSTRVPSSLVLTRGAHD